MRLKLKGLSIATVIIAIMIIAFTANQVLANNEISMTLFVKKKESEKHILASQTFSKFSLQGTD